MEIWKTIPILQQNYEASNLGRIRAKKRTLVKKTKYGGLMQQTYNEKILKPSLKKGYANVHLGLNGKKYNIFVHRLILLAFVGLPVDEKIFTRHLNGIPNDNRIENLAWGSHYENMQDRKLHGNYKNCDDHSMAKLNWEKVNYIRSSQFSPTSLSRLFDISISQILRIKNNESWVV